MLLLSDVIGCYLVFPNCVYDIFEDMDLVLFIAPRIRAHLMIGDSNGHNSMPTLALANDFRISLLGDKFLDVSVPGLLFGVTSESDVWNCCGQFSVQMEQAL